MTPSLLRPHTPSPTTSRPRGSRWLIVGLVTLTLAASPSLADEIAFERFDDDAASGIVYERTRSLSYQQVEALQQQSLVTPVPFTSTIFLPHRAGGFPGVAVIDHDDDGDLDLYVTNGPGTANSLFVNQLAETGSLAFVDVGAISGADATDQDSNGVCFGDLDNDGDDDLVVLGREEANRLFENLGHGQFQHVASSGLEGGTRSHIGCTLGDIDGDGLLDVFVGNATDLADQAGLVGIDPFAFNHRNQLFQNQGGLQFTDVSATSGVLDLLGLETSDPQPATITWAVGMADVDADGDIDILHADDQASFPGAARGLIHVLLNDGTGHFTDQPINLSPFSVGNWMSLSFGDLNCDGHLDLFSSNFGDYGSLWLSELFGLPPYLLGQEMSRWLLGNGDGTFADPLGDGESSVFGWGSGIADLDNDGDLDITYFGGIDGYLTTFEDNAGTVLENQGCSASFDTNVAAFRGEYTQHGTHGVALGDLDRDGRLDVVTTSEHTLPEDAPLLLTSTVYGNPNFDAKPAFWLQYDPNAEGMFTWGGRAMEPGSMTVELNTTPDTGGSVTLELVGSVGLVEGAVVNRTGVGALVTFTPRGGLSTMLPVEAGSSYLSQHAVERHFGLGNRFRGTVDIQWPGGVRNRVYNVRRGEHLDIPEIPCSIDTTEAFGPYVRCVLRSLRQLRQAGSLTQREGARLLRSALRAYRDEH